MAREIGRREGTPLYLVGGPVRDLLLGRSIRDVDLTIEGDATRFAKCLARSAGGNVRIHGRFKTATVVLPEGCRVDLVTARSETYDRPGALPRIHPGTIAEDLARRDVTINAMAVRLAPAHDPIVLDPHGGRDDLKERTVRFLHAASPVDDPTRAFRAVRYANRFGFRLARSAGAAIRRSVAQGWFASVSGDRIRRELEKILDEPGRAGAIALLGRVGLHAVLQPGLAPSRRILTGLRRAEALAPQPVRWFAFLLVWASMLAESEVAALSRRLNLRRDDAAALQNWPRTLARLRSEGSRGAAGGARVSPLSPEERLAVSASLGAGGRAALARSEADPLALRIRGRDLLRAGASPGPAIGSALARTLTARRDGRIAEKDELDYALAALRSGA